MSSGEPIAIGSIIRFKNESIYWVKIEKNLWAPAGSAFSEPESRIMDFVRNFGVSYFWESDDERIGFV